MGAGKSMESTDIFTEAEVNASGITQYELGLNEGNTSGIAWMQANPSVRIFFGSRGECLGNYAI